MLVAPEMTLFFGIREVGRSFLYLGSYGLPIFWKLAKSYLGRQIIAQCALRKQTKAARRTVVPSV